MDQATPTTTQLQPGSERVVRGDRVARTREAIIAATLTLAMEGEVAPIVRDIAQLAGVSARTVFQHFADTAELYVAVLTRVLAVMADLPEPAIGWTLERRVEGAADAFSSRFEQFVPMWPFFQALQQRSAEAAGLVVGMYAASRTQVGRWFASELATLGAQARERTLNALCMSLAPEGWIVLRQRLGLTVDDAREEWRFMVKALLTEEAKR
jgi:AcrR family transcriptional regulator